jgi:prepilin-type processing-associated H-X9-DG protein
MLAANCSYNLVTNVSESSASAWMHACDKDGGTNVAAASFGGNHDGAGGNILFIDGSVQWYEKSSWPGASNNIIWGDAFPPLSDR